MKYRNSIAATALLGMAIVAAPASAQEKQRIEAGDVLLRVRGILVAPTEKTSGIAPTFPTEHASVNNSVMPEVDVTWMATDSIGFELIAATTKHSASGTSGTTGGIGKLASTWVLPPTLTAQYHFNSAGAVRPYVGAGINYTIFYSEKASSGLKSAVGPTKVHMSDSVGWAAQAGIDVDITPKFFLNLDVKYIDMDTTATLRTTAIGTQKLRVHLDPVVVGVGVGFRL
ncbi:OmpW family outer membrane protein [Sphingomonas sp. ZT3P38]|uniref:OmpW/AlkL family protein n=1 Tax=Parasphingomonas zepuensis TaxID=3096161 RepID=UPI002FC97D71